MKNLIVFLSLSLLLLPAEAQFKAKMYFTDMGKNRVFTIYSAGEAYRYEFNEDGQAGIIIGQEGSAMMTILMPQQKIAMKMPTGNPMSMGNDPVGSYNYFKTKGIIKEIGIETVNGIKCTKAELWNEKSNASGQLSQKMYTVWISEKYDFPMKIISHISGSGESKMELKDLEPWTPDAQSFEVPSDYMVMN